MKLFEGISEFDWDENNITKKWYKHLVFRRECEEIFLNFPIFVFEDIEHSVNELRDFALGKTFGNRYLFIVFTIRKNKIRVISARDMNKKEKEIYDEEAKKYT